MIQQQSVEMCNRIQSSSKRMLSGNKRRYDPIAVMLPSHFVTKQPACHQYKRSRVQTKSSKSVTFCPQVHLRCILPGHANSHQESSWINNAELRQMKDNARRLAKSHYILHNIKNAPLPCSQVHPVRYEMKGESLRGMEHITDLSMGKLRQVAKAEANQSVNEEQYRQLLLKALNSSDGDEFMVSANGFRVDTNQLSRVYGEKTQAALMYSRKLAEEDAREAAEILAQDL
jgi:hypothetical protein